MDGLQIGRFFLAAALVLLAPGCALLAWLPSGTGSRRDLLSTLADAIAFSIAIPALLALALFVVGLRVGGWFVAGMYALCLLLLVAAGLKRRIQIPSLRCDPGWWVGGLLGIAFFAGLVAWRFYQARTLALPAWVDSVHHSLIVRKMLEYGGLPPDLSPYLPAPFSYHYGFHLIAALFVFWSGVSPEQALLGFGQVINAAVALSVYRAAVAFTGPSINSQPEDATQGPLARWSRKAAPYAAPVLAALLVGFDFQMPAYYLTWGRYTLLAGLILLGPAAACAVELYARMVEEHDRPGWQAGGARLVLLVAGLCVVHYFALLLLGLFLVVMGLVSVARGYRSRDCWLALARLAALALLGILLASPWIYRVWKYTQGAATVQMILPVGQSQQVQEKAAGYLKYLLSLMAPRRNEILMGMAGVAALAAVLRPRLYVLLGWGLLLFLLSLPWGPRLGPFRQDLYVIILFFPAAMLLAEMLAAGGTMLGSRTRPWAGLAAVMLAGAIFLAWGLRDMRSVINSGTIFVNRADVAALDWVKANTPPTARFYINSKYWQQQIYRGVDGGYWLMPYTGRYSLVPPVPYTWEALDSVQQVNDWAKRSEKLNGCTPEFWSLVREANLNYVYLRKGQGSLQPDMLAKCPRLKQVYGREGVYIYEILLPR